MLDTLDAAAVRRWCAGGLAALRRRQREIDDLNVYPVPDGDTGTNLVLTLAAAQRALAAVPGGAAPGVATGGIMPEPPGPAMRALARGALLGARGNSGVILAQILRGLADALEPVPAPTGRDLADALRAAATAAYEAVAEPVEGTLLTVVAAAARGAAGADPADLGTVSRAAAAAGAAALARTPEQLPVLARSGVVDAGGQGLCVLLDALVEVVAGTAPEWPAETAGTPDRTGGMAGDEAGPSRPPATAVREHGSAEYAYEVQFLLDADPAAVDRMRRTLTGLGDSLAVVGDRAPTDGAVTTWNVHVHVNDVGAAIEAGVVAGRPYRISVVRFAEPAPPDGPRPAIGPPPEGSHRPAGAPPPTPTPNVDRAAVVVAPGAGLAALFAAEGVTVVPGEPSADDLLRAIRATAADRVVVLPDNPDAQAAARAAARRARSLGITVSVVPTRSPVQALAALAVRDGGRPFEEDVIAMAEAAGACRYAEIRVAGREALTVAGRCSPGDVLGMVEGEVHLIGTDLVETSQALLDRLLGGGGELVTLLLGADAPAGLAEAVRTHVTRRWPFVEVHDYPGGQPFYPLMVGIE